MIPAIHDLVKNLSGKSVIAQSNAYQELTELTTEKVTWVYEVWDDLVALLSHSDNRARSIAAQLLCSLAKSDFEHRITYDFDKIMAVTKDEIFVTARHAMQGLWKIGVINKSLENIVVSSLAARFKTVQSEKNASLIRYDILFELKQIFDAKHSIAVLHTAQTLIALEEDEKSRKKYMQLWRNTFDTYN
jgi:hypothetical protein